LLVLVLLLVVLQLQLLLLLVLLLRRRCRLPSLRVCQFRHGQHHFPRLPRRIYHPLHHH
jgi:hypothetical protein